MARWRTDCRACKALWTTLLSLKQVFTSFEKSGDLAIGDLSFYNKPGGSEQQKQEATALSIQLDKVFTGVRGARYADNVSKNKALSDMMQVLLQENRQVKHLAQVVNNNYVFI